MVEWGGHHGGWGGFGPPSYIVKKCPEVLASIASFAFDNLDNFVYFYYSFILSLFLYLRSRYIAITNVPLMLLLTVTDSHSATCLYN
jgi:hypothetical protein